MEAERERNSGERKYGSEKLNSDRFTVSTITYMEFHIQVLPAASVFLPEASTEVSHQLPDEGEERVVVGVLGDLQVPVHEGAEVGGEELREDVVGEKLLQVQAVLQEEADKLGPVLYEGREHDFLQVS